MVQDSFRIRVLGLVTGLLFLFVLLVWAATATWREVGEVRQRLTVVNMESFRLAGQFQREVLQLDDLLLEVQSQGKTQDWPAFLTGWQTLDRWIDEQKPILRTERERSVLEEIDRAYDDYRAAAARMVSNSVSAAPDARNTRGEIQQFERESARLLNLGFKLADAHRDSLDQLLVGSYRSLAWLLRTTSVALVCLALSGAFLAWVVYQRQIRPLRHRLVEAEALAQRQEKLASLGVLAAGVAHEIRNPLTAIKVRAFMMQRRHPAGSEDRVAIDVIEGEITRLEKIVRDFLDFARPRPPELGRFGLSEAVGEACGLIRPVLAKDGVDLVVGVLEQAAVVADGGQIRQVLLNLLRNAAEATGSGGRVLVSLRRTEQRIGGIQTAMATIDIEDDGDGMSEAVQARLFDPFFTTKASGTGLGLSIALQLAERNGGLLHYRTSNNHGTCFSISLPLVDTPGPADTESKPSPPSQRIQ